MKLDLISCLKEYVDQGQYLYILFIIIIVIYVSNKMGGHSFNSIQFIYYNI